MPRGAKSTYTDKQERKAKHIGYEKRRRKHNAPPGLLSTKTMEDDKTEGRSGHGKDAGNPAAKVGGAALHDARQANAAHRQRRAARRESVMCKAVPTDIAAGGWANDDGAIAERDRCVSLLRRKAKSFEERKLFNISRALIAIAKEIAVGR